MGHQFRSREQYRGGPYVSAEKKDREGCRTAPDPDRYRQRLYAERRPFKKLNPHPNHPMGIKLKITLAFSTVFILLSLFLSFFGYQHIHTMLILDDLSESRLTDNLRQLRT